MGQKPFASFGSGANSHTPKPTGHPSAAKTSREHDDRVRMDTSQDLAALPIVLGTVVVLQPGATEKIHEFAQRRPPHHVKSCFGSGQHEGPKTWESQCHIPQPVGCQDRNLRCRLGKHTDHFCPTDYDAKGSACDMSQKIARSAFEALDPPRTRGRLLPRF